MEQTARNVDKVVIDAIQRRHDPDVTLRISTSVPDFLGGELIRVEVVKGDHPLPASFAYVVRDRVRNTFTSVDELARWVSSEYDGILPGSTPQKRGDFPYEAVPAVIAIFITITICGLVFAGAWQGRSGFNVPEILSNALTIILGFYFGSEIQRRTGQTVEGTGRVRRPSAGT